MGGLPATRAAVFKSASHAPICGTMNYVLALLLPPLSILIAGRPLVALIVFFIWVPAIIFSGGLTHPMFILLAWILIYQSAEERRHRARLDNRRD